MHVVDFAQVLLELQLLGCKRHDTHKMTAISNGTNSSKRSASSSSQCVCACGLLYLPTCPLRADVVAMCSNPEMID